METELLEIQPHELQFVFELNKQSSCSIQLVNKTQHHVAFKVKTTSPKKYCVRPNVGVIMPKSTCEFTVTMQAQRSVPPDMMGKDKFLIQSTIVPAGTTDVHITPEVFIKEESKFIEENKLRVSLICPPESPRLSPINGALKQGVIEAPILKGNHGLNEVNYIKQEAVVWLRGRSGDVAKAVNPPKVIKYQESPEKDANIKSDKEVMKVANDVEPYVKDVNLCIKDDLEGIKLVKDISEIKSKLRKLESKLGEAEVTISKLTEERKSSIRERDVLKEELALLRSRRGTKTVHDGFPLLFVVMVALISMTFGYLSH